jgi:murein DD-endopeptidase MepM/ murein hydrolase activator NlpD
VFLRHGNGLQTIYGHASELLVQPGQPVKKGQLIARVGCTGACTGSHLHFEVRVNGQAVDPLPILAGDVRKAAADEASTP